MLSQEMIQLITLHDLVQDTHEAAKINAGIDADAGIHVHASRQDTSELMRAAALLGWVANQAGFIVWVDSPGLLVAQVTVFYWAPSAIESAEFWADLMDLRQSERGREIQAYIHDLSPVQILARDALDRERDAATVVVDAFDDAFVID